MPEIIRKIVSCDVKEISDRILEFIGSTEDVDRDGEVISAAGWDLKNYKKNPVFMWAHNYSQPPIGKANRVWVDKATNQLKFNIEFADIDTYEFADTIYKLYKGGFLKATSVGFKPDLDAIVEGDGDKTPRRTYNKQELLELSGVAIPSNPAALISAREEGVITVKEFEAVTKPEETENYFRIPVPGEDGKHDGHRIRTIDISEKEGIKAVYCGECKKVITYLFSKDDKFNWTMASAEAWVREHGKEEIAIEIKEPSPKDVSQEQIADEFDYLIRLIESKGLNTEVQTDAWNLVRDLLRLPGADIPVDIQAEIGAVLNRKNQSRLEQIKQLAQEIMDSAKHEEPEKQLEPEEPDLNEISKTIAQVIAQVMGK